MQVSRNLCIAMHDGFLAFYATVKVLSSLYYGRRCHITIQKKSAELLFDNWNWCLKKSSKLLSNYHAESTIGENISIHTLRKTVQKRKTHVLSFVARSHVVGRTWNMMALNFVLLFLIDAQRFLKNKMWGLRESWKKNDKTRLWCWWGSK
jgi:hypothetical protein